MLETVLRPFEDVESIKGLSFPAGVSVRQLVITGPPGSGKSTEIATLGGWPEEGFLDLTERRWWRSRMLRFLPREVHLGLPFQGHTEPLTLFEDEWRDADSLPQLNLSRIFLPPSDRWCHRYVFEFLLPPAERVFVARSERAYRQSHPVDVDLSLEMVQAQMDVYRRIALHLHRAGLWVMVRDDYGGAPKIFEAERRRGGAPWTSAGGRVKRPLIARMIEMLAGTSSAPIVDSLGEIHLAGKKIRVPFDLLPLEITLGPQKLRVYPELPLTDGDRPDTPNALVLDPRAYAEEISGFLRLGPGGRTRIGRGAEDRIVTPELPDGSPPRLEIAHDWDLISLVDLHSPSGTTVADVEAPEESDLLRRGVRHRMARITEILGGAIGPLDPAAALECLRDVNGRLESQRYRPEDERGRPGGLIELPVEITPVIIGDLHASLGNLLTVLSANRFLDELEAGRACVIVLGDAVHPEDGDLEEMESSILIMDVLLRFARAFPDHFIYLRGNHDGFSREITKGGVQQGRVWKKSLREERGKPYVEELRRFYHSLARVAASRDFVTCHGGPPLEAVTRDRLINLYEHRELRHQLTWNRLQKASNPAGYTKREVRALKHALGLKTVHPLIVSHTPEHGGETVWLDHGGIKGHHIVHSANSRIVGVFSRICGRIVPLVYPTESLSALLGSPTRAGGRSAPSATGSGDC